MSAFRVHAFIFLYVLAIYIILKSQILCPLENVSLSSLTRRWHIKSDPMLNDVTSLTTFSGPIIFTCMVQIRCD